VRRSLGWWWLAVLAIPAPIAAQLPAERDWGAALREDAQALHDDIAANHPGPVNRKDPGFAPHNDAELRLALARARDARTYSDYFYALRQYVSSFNDGHMGFGAYGDTPHGGQWPGFVTDYDARGDIKVILSDEAQVQAGAKLLGCDGMSAEKYAAATLGKMWGRWQLQSQRIVFGRFLFLDEGSRYIPHAVRCSFAVGGRESVVDLAWRPVKFRDVFQRLDLLSPGTSPEFGARVLADGTRWFAMPSFNADPNSSAGKALPGLIAAMRDDRRALVAAPAIVLDLRGNGGGSSDWSRQIAEILWGRAAVRKIPSTEQVDWRVSRANLDSIRSSYAQQSAGSGLSDEMRTWFESVIGGLGGALARGDKLWREENKDDKGPTSAVGDEASPPLTARVYMLTDASCGSACLDAADLWRALGAVHIGQTTSADTLYMDVRKASCRAGSAPSHCR
jgi:hypothetical protein